MARKRVSNSQTNSKADVSAVDPVESVDPVDSVNNIPSEVESVAEAVKTVSPRLDGWRDIESDPPKRQRMVHVESIDKGHALASLGADDIWRDNRNQPLKWKPVRWHSFPDPSED